MFFFFQAEDGIRVLVRSRGLGDVYKRQVLYNVNSPEGTEIANYYAQVHPGVRLFGLSGVGTCLLYTSDAADDLLCVDLGGRRVIKKKKNHYNSSP